MVDGDAPIRLSDNATVAVLQATQLDHERRITENSVETRRSRELFEQKFEQIRTELSERENRLYAKMGEISLRNDGKLEKIDEKLDFNKHDTDEKLELNASNADSRVRQLRYWIMGAVRALVLNLLGVIFFLATRTITPH